MVVYNVSLCVIGTNSVHALQNTILFFTILVFTICTCMNLLFIEFVCDACMNINEPEKQQT